MSIESRHLNSTCYMQSVTAPLNSIRTDNGVRYLGWMCAIVLIQNCAVDLIGSLLLPNESQVAEVYSWLLSVIVLPIIETLLFQAFGCWVLNLFGCPRLATLLITAFVFGLPHSQPQNILIPFISASLAGFIFSWMYLRRLLEGRPWQGCAEVAFVHIFNNATVYTYAIYFAPETIKFAT